MNWRERTRVAIWPRRSWSRSISYLGKRVLRLTASPHAIAAGMAAGVFASCTPFIGFHFIIAFIVAYVLAGNMIAAATGTFAGNPATFPFLWGATYATGKFIVHGFNRVPNGTAKIEQLHQISPTDFWSLGFVGMVERFVGIWEPVILPMAIGSVPIGIFLGVAAYVITRSTAVSFRHARMRRLEAKARARAAANAGAAEDEDEVPVAETGDEETVEPAMGQADAAALAQAEAGHAGEEPEKQVGQPERALASDAADKSSADPQDDEEVAEDEPSPKPQTPKTRGRRKKQPAVAAQDDAAEHKPPKEQDAVPSPKPSESDPEPETGEQADAVEADASEDRK